MINYFSRQLNLKIEEYKENSLYEPIKYSLNSGGKRIRPLLILNLAKSLNLDYTSLIDVAIAIEFIHNYSLIHDDLPCMDNDLYRRGKLTTHAKFGEYTAVLTGDALLSDAFGIVASSKTLTNKDKIISAISKSIGSFGMIEGQVLDIKNAGHKLDVELIKKIHQKKTCELIKCCFLVVLLQFNIKDDRYIKVAELIGNIYQMQDEIFDFYNENDNSNYAKIIGIKKANERLSCMKEKINMLLGDNDTFREFINSIIARTY